MSTGSTKNRVHKAGRTGVSDGTSVRAKHAAGMNEDVQRMQQGQEETRSKQQTQRGSKECEANSRIRRTGQMKHTDQMDEAGKKEIPEQAETAGNQETEQPDGKADDRSLIWEEVSVEHLVQDEWIDFRRLSYRLPDGKVWEPYYNYSRRNYVVVVASDEEGRFLLVRQYRHGISQITTEFPAGGIEVDGSEGYITAQDQNRVAESALDAAKRELKEETGYVSEEWEPLMRVPSNATMSDNYAYLFRAKNCRLVSGQSLDAMEFLNVKLHTAEEIETMIRDEHFQQAVHILAWMLAKEN